MLHVGLDLSRSRLDVCVMDAGGGVMAELVVSPDVGGLGVLAGEVAGLGGPVAGVIESMTGARFVHDQLEAAGWEVAVADAYRVKGLAPLAAKTDRIDAAVLAELSRRDLVPEIWLPSPGVRAMRERARFRLHLVKRRTAVKNRVHSVLMTHGIPNQMSDLFGVAGRAHLARLGLPAPWSETVAVSLEVIDHLDRQIHLAGLELRRADHPYLGLLETAPGLGPVLAYTVAAEIGDISRFATAKKLVGYSGLCPRVMQSGDTDRRGPLTKHGPRWLRWALIEATTWAARHPAYRDRYWRTRRRLGPMRGPKVARVEVARSLATAIWWMLTTDQPFAPRSPHPPLVA